MSHRLMRWKRKLQDIVIKRNTQGKGNMCRHGNVIRKEHKATVKKTPVIVINGGSRSSMPSTDPAPEDED